jgi:hypothetical protein
MGGRSSLMSSGSSAAFRATAAKPAIELRARTRRVTTLRAVARRVVNLRAER